MCTIYTPLSTDCHQVGHIPPQHGRANKILCLCCKERFTRIVASSESCWNLECYVTWKPVDRLYGCMTGRPSGVTHVTGCPSFATNTATSINHSMILLSTSKYGKHISQLVKTKRMRNSPRKPSVSEGVATIHHPSSLPYIKGRLGRSFCTHIATPATNKTRSRAVISRTTSFDVVVAGTTDDTGQPHLSLSAPVQNVLLHYHGHLASPNSSPRTAIVCVAR